MGQIEASRGFFEIGHHLLILASHPARATDAGAFKHCIDTVFVEQTAGHHFKLQHANRAQDQVAIIGRLEDLYRTLFTQLLQTLVQLLDLQRITDARYTEEVRCEIRNTGELQQFAFRKAVADLHIAVVGQADDVTGVGFFDLLTARSHEGHHRRHLDVAVQAQMLEFHAALETARAHTQEGNTVAVSRIHIGLNLEDETGERRFIGLDTTHGRIAAARSRRPVKQRVENFANAKVVDGRAEKHRSLNPGQEIVQIERVRSAMHQFDFHLELFDFQREHLDQLGIVDTLDDFDIAVGAFFTSLEQHDFIAQQVLHAAKTFAHANRPGYRRALNLQHRFQFIEQLQRIAGFAVHLVHEGDDGRIAHAANVEQFDGLLFHALG